MKFQKKGFTTSLTLIFTAVLFLLLSSLPAYGQDFDKALQLYENEQFEKAVNIFQNIDTPEAILFTGKSYYSLGEYLKAKSWFRKLSPDVNKQIRQEAEYTIALTDFNLKQFGSSLNRLYPLKQELPKTALVNDAMNLYEGILDYLTLGQRRVAYQMAQYEEIKADLVRSAFGKVDYHTARLLLDELENSTIPTDEEKYQDLEKMVEDSLTYSYRGPLNSLSAPRGITYDIGAVLPRFDSGSAEYDVSQGLYHGYLLAAEEFNQRNTGKKAFIRYQNTGANMDSAGYAMNHLAWSSNVDVVLGPLFSEPAMKIGDLAQEYHIPVLAPLANADSLNIDNPYVFQANPTFSSHGKKMAQYAVKQLKMDTLAVFAENKSLGEASAYAFRREAERLGAHIKHFFVEDLQSQGFDITEYTKHFAPDTIQTSSESTGFDSTTPDTLIRNSLDGIYAPFTGQAAPTLIDLMMIDLQVMNSSLTVLGSPEWGATDIPEERLQGRSIYFSESFYINNKSERVDQFREEYKQRFGQKASRYAMIGYDSADFLLKILEQVDNPALLKKVIKSYPLYEGLISNIKFDGTHVNQEVKIFEISPQGIQPAVY